MPNELGSLDKGISRKSIKSATWFLLATYNKMEKEKINLWKDC